MVSLSLFTVVMLATISSLLIVNDASRKVQSMRAVMDNLNFAVEAMSRTIRTGSEYICDAGNTGPNVSCPFADGNPADSIRVRSEESTPGNDIYVDFRLGSAGGVGVLERQRTVGGVPTGWQAMTSSEIDVQELQFYVDGAETSDLTQPSVTLFIKGTAATNSTQVAPFSIQTKISQRTIE
ncbi:MAG TPA: hypothetical protein VLB02_01290 [Candidatus Paceibacterota bacterium]|nr:hypothetical protein [Candidatus Paceibacterota bacterium]